MLQAEFKAIEEAHQNFVKIIRYHHVSLKEVKMPCHWECKFPKAEFRSRPIFGGSGFDPSKIKQLRLQLVNCKAENHEFVSQPTGPQPVQIVQPMYRSVKQNTNIYT